MSGLYSRLAHYMLLDNKFDERELCVEDDSQSSICESLVSPREADLVCSANPNDNELRSYAIMEKFIKKEQAGMPVKRLNYWHDDVVAFFMTELSELTPYEDGKEAQFQAVADVIWDEYADGW